VLQPVVVLVCCGSVGCWSLPREPAELPMLFVSVHCQQHGNVHFGQHVCVVAVCTLSSQHAYAGWKVPASTLLHAVVLSYYVLLLSAVLHVLWPSCCCLLEAVDVGGLSCIQVYQHSPRRFLVSSASFCGRHDVTFRAGMLQLQAWCGGGMWW